MLLTAFILTGCAAYKIESKMQQIELGMSKKKVVSILGKNYNIVGARITPEGAIESISYLSTNLGNEDSYYILSFKDGKLVEWFKEQKFNNNHNHPHNH